MKRLLAAVRRKGFTLIELLVVIAIIAVLIALLVPAVQKVREAANRTQCQNNMRQLGLGLHNYISVMGVLPMGRQPTTNASVLAQILPYLEQANKYAKFDFTQDLNSPANAAAQAQDVPIFLCPSDPSVGQFTVTLAGATQPVG